MKPIVTIFTFLFFFVQMQAATFYVDNINGNDNNDGLSWESALKNISGALFKAKSSPYDTSIDDIFVKGGNYNTSSKLIIEFDNLYGGFEGIESNPSQRPLEDKDGNGIVELWEFKFPSKISSTFDASASSAFQISNSTNTFTTTFNGFSITQIGTVGPNDNSKNYKIVQLLSAHAIMENTTIHNCHVNFPQLTSSTVNGVVVDMVGGTVKSCLFEKNYVTVGLINGSTVNIGPVFQMLKGVVDRCVFRNNKVNFAAVGPAASAGASYTIQGALISLRTSVAGTNATMNNCLIYNNEASYSNNAANITGNQWNTVATNGALIKMGYTGTPVAADSIVGCVIANNKITNLGGSTLYANSHASKSTNVINTVFWNNKNEIGDKNLFTLSTFATGANNIGWVVHNAYTSGGPANTENGWIGNNLADLNLLNADSKGPNFKAPTTFTGVNRTAESPDSIAIAHANWQLVQGSYLIGKGFSISGRQKDFTGNSFSSARSIGAYEFDGLSAIINQKADIKIVSQINAKLISEVNGEFSIFLTTGIILKNKMITKGEEISLPKGIYILKAKTEQGNIIQKIII